MQRNITFRASEVLVATIEELAEARGSSRSAAIKAAIVEATLPDHATAIPTEHEVLVLLSGAARGGSVSAMKELLAHHRERKHRSLATDDMTVIDELAARRFKPTGRAG